MPSRLTELKLITRTAFFIASKSILRGSLMVKFVTVFILLLTFLNLVVVGGLLVGITDDVGIKVKNSLTGDVFIEPAKEYNTIQNINDILSLVQNQNSFSYSLRLTSGATIEYEYKNVTGGKNPARASAVIAGIDPDQEKRVTNLGSRIIAGSFLEEGNSNTIVLGSSLVDGYTSGRQGTDATLGHVSVGEKVRVRLPNNNMYEFTVVGILNSKSSVVDQRAYVNEKILRQLLGSQGRDYSEMAINVRDSTTASSLIKKLQDLPMGNRNDIKSSSAAVPSAVNDLKKAFGMIGNIVSATALLVGIVTVFVIIFVNASSRRRYLGILKAQGISAPTLILSYVFQIIFYVAIGVILGAIILFAFLQPYFTKHPLSLPMADGHLLLTLSYVSIRVILLFISSIISAFIPAWFIIRQNTLDAILGR